MKSRKIQHATVAITYWSNGYDKEKQKNSFTSLQAYKCEIFWKDKHMSFTRVLRKEENRQIKRIIKQQNHHIILFLPRDISLSRQTPFSFLDAWAQTKMLRTKNQSRFEQSKWRLWRREK